jgi:hypothetical protein
MRLLQRRPPGSLDLSNSGLWRTLAGGVAALAGALAWIALVEGQLPEFARALEHATADEPGPLDLAATA